LGRVTGQIREKRTTRQATVVPKHQFYILKQNKCVSKLLAWATALCLLLGSSLFAAEVRDYAVEVTAEVQISPARIQLSWHAADDGAGYTVARKAKDESTWHPLTTLPASIKTYSDADVQVGQGYEYRVLKDPLPDFGGSGYIYAGIELPVTEARGKLDLIVDGTYAADLQNELARLQQDLTGDGWIVLRHDVQRSGKPPEVRALIQADYNADPQNLKAVFLFGHVPVPYSGNLNPDGHPDHLGAWPADGYYGDMDGSWTDSSVNNTGAARDENKNVPGDGKFDQSTFPSDIELEVGRVDLANLPGFEPKTELDLLRQYLNKDHNFRQGQLPLPRRGLINDNFGVIYGEAFGSSGWRNFAPFFGSDNITSIPGNLFISTLSTNGYLCSYACGGGAYNFCNYVGGTGDFRTDIKSVFTFFLGSYFGDWDADNCFLRGPLGSPTYGLTAAWAGRPHWFVHHMALGETIGYGTKLTMNGQLYHPHQHEREVHIALMGDPTLRLHPVVPPSNAVASKDASGVHINWSPSSDTNIQGYYIYRADSAAGPFTRVTGALVTRNNFTDSSGAGKVYMVRAVKLESSASGTYFNPSQGAFASVTSGSTGGTPIALKFSSAGGEFSVSFPSALGGIYIIESSADLKSWAPLTTITAAGINTSVPLGKMSASSFYRVRKL
jgi:hypothetical protein